MAESRSPSRTTKQTSRQKVSPKKTTKRVTKSAHKISKKAAPIKSPSKFRTPVIKKQKKYVDPSFKQEIEHFVTQIESLSKALEHTMMTMSNLQKKSLDSLDTFINKARISSVKKDGTETFQIEMSDFQQFKNKIKVANSSSLAVENIPQIFLCSLVHKFDAYLGRLLRVVFFIKPELLSASEKSITFSDLAQFKSLKEARESIIEKEVESVIRDSHVNHFKWMENRFGILLRKNLDIWTRFVEITERRNLFVHCDGIVSSQYIGMCKMQGVEIDGNLKTGDQLKVDPPYFREAFDCFYEIGIKLGHVLWRKFKPGTIKDADSALHKTGYDLLKEERYELVKIILHFATDTLKKISSDEIRRINIINLCIAYKFSANKIRCDVLLDSEDWTACKPAFSIAVAVLKDNFTEAASIMKQIGVKGDVTSEDYSTWPLFKVFRKSKEFLASYHALFGKKFTLPEDIDIPTRIPAKRSTKRKKPHA